MKLTVNVTEECIRTGIPGDCQNCPIANAIMESGFEAVVGDDTIGVQVRHGQSEVYVATPFPAARFIADFDAGSPVEPFSFELYIPENDDEQW